MIFAGFKDVVHFSSLCPIEHYLTYTYHIIWFRKPLHHYLVRVTDILE
jgi:hypothetical protein